MFSQLVLVEVNVRQIDVFLDGQLRILAVPGVHLLQRGQLGAPDGIGPSLAVRQVSEEFVNAIVSKRSGERRVLHLLGADDRHSGVAEAADVQGLFQFRVSSALGPKPAPALLFELVAHLVEHGDVLVSALALAIQDVREEGDDAEWVLVAVLLQNLIAGDLDDLGRRDVGSVTLKGPVHDVTGSPAAVVFFGVALGAGWEVLDGRVALDAVLLGE